MEMTMNMGAFEEFNSGEMMEVNGGGPLAVAAAITAVCVAGKACYEIGTYFGKAVKQLLG